MSLYLIAVVEEHAVEAARRQQHAAEATFQQFLAGGIVEAERGDIRERHA
ncbi:MAG: hypothetical protein U0793_32800 [Gemmataceae bacterium]